MNVCTVEGVTAPVCATCGIPWDAGYFDESRVFDLTIQPLNAGEELVLARYQLHRNYCGMLMSFAQFTDAYARDNSLVLTPGYLWQVRVNGLSRDPYLPLDHILNPWGQAGMPVHLRMEEGGLVEIAIRNLDVVLGINDPRELKIVGGRITGRFWYNTDFGGRPNSL
jgi:hypothetical protein